VRDIGDDFEDGSYDTGDGLGTASTIVVVVGSVPGIGELNDRSEVGRIDRVLTFILMFITLHVPLANYISKTPCGIYLSPCGRVLQL